MHSYFGNTELKWVKRFVDSWRRRWHTWLSVVCRCASFRSHATLLELVSRFCRAISLTANARILSSCWDWLSLSDAIHAGNSDSVSTDSLHPSIFSRRPASLVSLTAIRPYYRPLKFSGPARAICLLRLSVCVSVILNFWIIWPLTYIFDLPAHTDQLGQVQRSRSKSQVEIKTFQLRMHVTRREEAKKKDLNLIQ